MNYGKDEDTCHHASVWQTLERMDKCCQERLTKYSTPDGLSPHGGPLHRHGVHE